MRLGLGQLLLPFQDPLDRKQKAAPEWRKGAVLGHVERKSQHSIGKKGIGKNAQPHRELGGCVVTSDKMGSIGIFAPLRWTDALKIAMPIVKNRGTVPNGSTNNTRWMSDDRQQS